MTDSQLLGSRYQFVKTLGSDPKGSTYLVVDTFLEGHPKCVVKKLRLPGKSSKAIRFILVLLKKKAEALKHVGSHEQIPKILAYFEEANHFYLVEEFIPGRPLSEVLKPRQTLSEAAVQHLIREVLKILLVVHSWGVIHRCIKPSNLIQRHPDNQLVLTGFGIFKEISNQNGYRHSSQYEKRSANGASAYVPIEQAAGQRHFSSDIYAVGMIGIQALTGLPPQELQQLKRMGHASEGRIPESMSWHSYAKVSPEFQNILDRMISSNPDHRYTTAASVLEDLDKLSIVRPMEASSVAPAGKRWSITQSLQQDEGVPSRTSKRWLFLGLTGLMLLLVGLGAVATRVPQRIWAANALKQGQVSQESENYVDAIAQYTQAIQNYPTSEAYTNRGIALFLNEEYLRAQEDFTRAIELDASQSQPFYYRGNTRYLLGDLDGALEDYTKAININPDGTLKSYVNRGTVRAELGDDEAAIVDYSEAIQRNPNLAEAYVNRCLSYSNIGKHQEAITDCSQAIRLEPNSVLAYQNRGLVRRRLGEPIGAIQDFNIAINLDPTDPDPYYNRGLAREEVGEMIGAIADYTKAIELDPAHTFAYYDRAIARMKSEDYEGALADLEIAAKLCLDAGREGCYNDTQYAINEIQGILHQQQGTPSSIPPTREFNSLERELGEIENDGFDRPAFEGQNPNNRDFNGG
ncbi:MAG: serine/threonine-protein kinase [Leptolyngbyaceae bacterium]|nr:serine/threonine-protein kinase [Leptolyngbyaceae bacterium]